MIATTTAWTTRSEWSPKWALVAAATALGDWLFHGHRPGASVAVFLAVLAACAVAGNVVRARGTVRLVASGFLVAGILPLVETLDVLSCLIGASGLALAATLAVNGAPPSAAGALASALRLLALGPFRLLPDLFHRWRGDFAAWPHRLLGFATGWVVPASLCVLFAILFASANPIIDGWVTGVEWSVLVGGIDGHRVLLWASLASVAWGFVAIRPHRAARHGMSDWTSTRSADVELPRAALRRATIRRSLILLNLLFGVQTTLDLTYLWGGARLPDGMSYAAYAHRGAYPLIITALLAGGLVIAAMRPGGAGERSKAVRALVLAWISQNVLLVLSSMLRLDLYVAAYSLTLTRVAAFAWMALVAVGLVLIVVRIERRRSNAWLLAANGLALAAVLYSLAFANLPALVSDYNVAHSSDLGTGEQAFDVRYAMSLGPQAIPAVDRYLAAHHPTAWCVVRWRDAAATEQVAETGEWRAWTFRGWRLSHYLQRTAFGPPVGATAPRYEAPDRGGDCP